MLRKQITTLRPLILQQSATFATFNEKKLESLKEEIESFKKTSQWRTPMGDRPEDWNSKFKAFGNEEQTSDWLVFMQQDFDFTPAGIKSWWRKRKLNTERQMQQYIAQRHEILGNDLAAAHFIVFRGGSVRFVNEKKWVKMDDEEEYVLPSKFDPNYKVEAIQCDDMRLYYEGLENLRYLQFLKTLSFRNVKTFDDWCLDRVSGSGFPSLEVLDVSGTAITANGLSCLYRLPQLKVLVVDDPQANTAFELACTLLEIERPKLQIVPASEV